MDVRLNCLAKAILMSTHNIGFYEDLTKLICQLSSNSSDFTVFLFSEHFCSYLPDFEELRLTLKFLNFRTPENFAVIYLKFKQRG